MEPDLLGAPYERQTIDLGHDDEGPVVATLVRRRADRPTGRAVLYVHGYVDYFFQTHLADFFVERGWHFYALDLRKCGRSLLPHQTPNFCRDLTDYFPELDAAVEIIRADGNRTLLVDAHSTGGLITALWVHERRADGIVDGLFLNSPFFDINAPWLVRRPIVAAACRLARRAPYRAIPRTTSPLYGQSLHAEHHGEWSYDLGWKPLAGFPVRLGWLAAVQRAQRRLRAGLAIPVPVLVACSTRTFRGSGWHESAALADTVLDVEHIVRWAPRLGPHVTVVRFDGGLHDLTLSGPAVRRQLFTELDRWVAAFVAPHPSAVPVPRAEATPTSEPSGGARPPAAPGTAGTAPPAVPARTAARPPDPARTTVPAPPTPARAARTPNGTAEPTPAGPAPARRPPNPSGPAGPADPADPRSAGPADPADPRPAGSAGPAAPRPDAPESPTPDDPADPRPGAPAGTRPGGRRPVPARPDGTGATSPGARPGGPG